MGVDRKITFEVGKVYPVDYSFGFGVQHAEVLRILRSPVAVEVEFRLIESGYKSRISAGAFKLLYLDAITRNEEKSWEVPRVEI